MMQWLRDNCPRSGDLTHTSMAGGSFTVPAALAGACLAKYARGIEAGQELSLIERRTPVFKLFVDLDWLADGEVGEDTQQELASFVAKQAYLIYTPALGQQRVVVATRTAAAQPEGLLKSGIHMHWPGILTDAHTALVFRDTTIARCRERFGDGLFKKPWEDVIDEHVFKGCGLRMVYSCKKTAADVYRPRWLICLSVESQHGMSCAEVVSVTDCEASPLQWARECSIRYHGMGRTEVRECVREMQERPSAPMEEASLEQHRAGLDELRQALPPCYSGIRFVKLLQGDNGKYILRTDSRTCLNLEPDGNGEPSAHRSNGVYLVVDRATTYQACFCNCDTTQGRLNGPCKGFKSPGWRTPPALSASLFPPLPETPFGIGGVQLTSTAATAVETYERFFKPAPPKKARRGARQDGSRKKLCMW